MLALPVTKDRVAIVVDGGMWGRRMGKVEVVVVVGVCKVRTR